MVEPLSAAFTSFFVEKLAAPALLSLAGQAKGALTALDKETKQLLYLASNAYYKRFRERHGELKVLGMSRPASLDDIYVKVRLLDRKSVQMFESIDAIEETFRTAKQRSFGRTDCKTKPGYKLANAEQYLMVLGGPGAGKSTFLRKMGMEALQFKQEQGFLHECIPVFVELKRFKELPIDIEDLIVKEFEICRVPKSKELTHAFLEQGKLLVLLDGLDEVPTANRSEAVTQIQDFVDRYSKNRFIVSCRIAAYNQNFRRFTDVGVAEFDDKQIRDFIDNWFGKGSSRAKDCWEEVSKAESVGVKELAQTPLLLTLVCLLFEKGGELPIKRATLYDRALRVLLEEWNASKELERDKPYKGLDTRAKELLLATIAFDFFEEDRLFFPRRELARKIEAVLQEEILPDEKQIDGNFVLKSIEVQHGILAEQGTDVYSFSHLTLQEFLAAVQIADNPNKHLNHAIENHLYDERWKEVFLLLVGIKQANDVLLAMENKIKTYILSPKIKKIITWLEEIGEGPKGKHLSAVKRGMALFVAADLAVCVSRSRFDKHSLTLEGMDNHRIRTISFKVDDSRALELSHALELYRALDLSRARVIYPICLSVVSNLSMALSFSIRFAQIDEPQFDEPQFDEPQSDYHFIGTMLSPFISEIKSIANQIPEDKLPSEQAKEYLSQLIDIWLAAFSLQREWLSLDIFELHILNDYLYANRLLIECRNTSVRLSRDVREGIIERILKL